MNRQVNALADSEFLGGDSGPPLDPLRLRVWQADHVEIAIGVSRPGAENGFIPLSDISQGLPGQWQSFVHGTGESPICKPRIHHLRAGVVVLQAGVLQKLGRQAPIDLVADVLGVDAVHCSRNLEGTLLPGADIDDRFRFVGADVTRQRLRGETSYEKEECHRCLGFHWCDSLLSSLPCWPASIVHRLEPFVRCQSRSRYRLSRVRASPVSAGILYENCAISRRLVSSRS